MEEAPARSETLIEKTGLSGAAVDLLTARCILPFLVPLAFSIYELVAEGTGSENYPYTYLPLIGSGLSIVCTVLYAMTLHSRSRSPWLVLAIFCKYVPYLFGLYIFGFLGLYGVLAVGSIVAGIFWMFLGYWVLYWIRVLSLIGVRPLPPELLSRLRSW